MSGLSSSLRRAAGVVAALSMLVVFVLFVFGVGMRYLANRPQNWIDESVTLLSVWGTFWTAAFVLKWPEHIAFDVLFNHLSAERRRFSLLAGALAFVAIIGAAMPGMIDYTLFLWRERTDALELRLDYVYTIFPLFHAAILFRLLLVIRNLAGPDWRDELARWAGEEAP